LAFGVLRLAFFRCIIQDKGDHTLGQDGTRQPTPNSKLQTLKKEIVTFNRLKINE